MKLFCKSTQKKSLFLRLYSRFSSSSCPTSPVPSHNQIARLILDQKSPSQALQTFRWASKLPNYAHSQSTYRALIHKLCVFRRFDTVQELLDEMPHTLGLPPDEDVFVTIVRGLGRARMIRQVLKVVDLVLKFDVRPSLKVYNSMLDVLVKEDIDIARRFYREKMMDAGIQGDDYTYGILMKGLCLTNRIAEAFKLLQATKSSNVVPNTVIYNTLLHALCKNGKVGRARSLMNEMMEPNDVTFNTLISAYCREENLIQALVMLEKSFNLGFFPDIVAVTKLLELLCNKGRVSEGVEVLERVESKGGTVDVVAYNTLIKGYCKIGKTRVGYRLLEGMERKGCLANVDTYNLLISGFLEAGNLDTALDLFNDMKSDGINWNFNTFDTLIKGLCSGGRTEDGFRVLELMEERKGGARGLISPYNSILYGLYKENRLDEALLFLTKMESLFPRAVDRSLSILGFCEEDSIQEAHRVYNQMVEEGGVPSAVVYDSLIRAFCREGSTIEAFELLNEMMGHGYFPVASTFNPLISVFCRQGKLVAAMKLLEDITERSCLPDSESFRPLVESLCQKKDFQKAESLILQMVGKDVFPDHLTWN